MKQISQEVMIAKDVSPIVLEAQHLQINDNESMNLATEFLSQLNKENDRLNADRETLTKPLNEALRNINARYKPKTDLLKKAIETIRTKLGSYQLLLVQAQRKEEEKIAKQANKGKISLEEAGELMVATDQMVEKKVVTDSGSLSFRTDYIVKIINKKKIPLEYMEPNESAILKALKEGIKVEGAILEEKMTPINKRV